jgi:hypothetical protein
LLYKNLISSSKVSSKPEWYVLASDLLDYCCHGTQRLLAAAKSTTGKENGLQGFEKGIEPSFEAPLSFLLSNLNGMTYCMEQS